MDTKKLRQKILDLAIHGKLVPQDPNDEPASVLLERIRAEKEQLIKEGKIKAPKKSKSAGDRSHYPKDMPFEVPEGWVWCKIEDIAESNVGLTYKPEDVCSDGVPVLRSNNIKNRRICTDGLIRVRAHILPKQFIKKGDLLICARNGSRNLVGKCALIEQDEEPMSFGAFMAVCRSTVNRWIFLILNSSFFNQYLDNSNSTAINQVTQSMLLSFDIPLPPKNEQARIYSMVERLFSCVDELEKQEQGVLAAIDDSRKRILELAIHGRLVPQDPTEEPASVLLRRINPTFTPAHNLHYLDCPSGWAVTQMKSIIELLSGRDLDNSRCNSEGYGVPYLVGASCIDKGRINTYRWTETPEVISKEGDVLLSCKGTVGEVVLNTMGNLHIARQFMAIRSKAPQYILPDYLGIIIKASIETLKKAARGIIPGISREDILGLTVMIPPSEEQQRILSRIAEFNQSVSLIVANTCN